MENSQPTKISDLTQEQRDKLVLDISENIKKLKPTDPEYISQLKVLNMLSKRKPKDIEFHFDID